jgi:hypothetical protein
MIKFEGYDPNISYMVRSDIKRYDLNNLVQIGRLVFKCLHLSLTTYFCLSTI